MLVCWKIWTYVSIKLRNTCTHFYFIDDDEFKIFTQIVTFMAMFIASYDDKQMSVRELFVFKKEMRFYHF